MTTAIVITTMLLLGAPPDSDKPPRLSSEDLKQPLIWGSECAGPDGISLGFGGQDQLADDGGGRTRIKVNGKWESISADLWAKYVFKARRALIEKNTVELRQIRQLARRACFEDAFDSLPQQPNLRERIRAVAVQVKEMHSDDNRVASSESSHFKCFHQRLALLYAKCHELLSHEEPGGAIVPQSFADLSAAIIALEEVAALQGAEPLPRALSPIVYEAQWKRFIVFGGDHGDFLMNDLWLYDPSRKSWEVRVAENDEAKPPPRANHRLTAPGDGTVKITGGYRYTSSTDYCGGQYVNHPAEEEWVYDLKTNRWKNDAPAAPAPSREYRTGPFDPQYFVSEVQTPRPSRAATAESLQALPENRWVAMKPPALPQLNRDWGTAILDPERDLILRFAGGHSAHGGSDVLHYHLATNRWELTMPVEFPLGQLYTNTEYPDGFNFNRRPWVTGHTYQNYGYAPRLKQLVFAGRETHNYFYDPDLGDWLPTRTAKPQGMLYGSCFYTLTLTSSPDTLYCWTQEGRLFSFDNEERNWREIKLQGEKLDGAVVDNSTIIYDGRRQRLLCCQKPYGDKVRYSGLWQAIDLPSGTVSRIVPENAAAAAAVIYLPQIRLDPEHDLLLCGCLLPDDGTGARRTPAFDLKDNRWISLLITGDHPHGPQGRNVSLGLVYDARRKLFWAVDAASRVFVLKLNPASADRRPL